MEPARSLAPLQREVLPPQKPQHGFGVLLVSSVAMFLAMVSSAFVMQVRATRTCPGMGPGMGPGMTDSAAPRAHAPAVPGDMDAARTNARAGVVTGDFRTGDFRTGDFRTGDFRVGDVVVAEDAVECGRPAYRDNPDGSLSVQFQTCPEPVVVQGVWIIVGSEKAGGHVRR